MDGIDHGVNGLSGQTPARRLVKRIWAKATGSWRKPRAKAGRDPEARRDADPEITADIWFKLAMKSPCMTAKLTEEMATRFDLGCGDNADTPWWPEI